MDVLKQIDQLDAAVHELETASSSNLTVSQPLNENFGCDGQANATSSKPDTPTSEQAETEKEITLQDIKEENEDDLPNEPQSPEISDSVRGNVNEENQNVQQFVNADIDPNNPLVLVQKVSLPSKSDNSREQSREEDNNEVVPAMDQENTAEGEEVINITGMSLFDLAAMLNSFSEAGVEYDDYEDD